ncbi:hypothetical protein TNCV_2926211 [Trichonephila clavipes]|nr:hypothetical protein TNCV_2926211 [Trichonephila clavipes]
MKPNGDREARAVADDANPEEMKSKVNSKHIETHPQAIQKVSLNPCDSHERNLSLNETLLTAPSEATRVLIATDLVFLSRGQVTTQLPSLSNFCIIPMGGRYNVNIYTAD